MLNIYSKCKLNRKFVDKKKQTIILKKKVDSFFPTGLCVPFFKIMFASD